MSHIRPRVRGDITTVELDGERVIWDPTSGELHHLNRSASAVMSLCDGGSSIAEIVEDLAAAFGVTTERVDADVRSLLRSLRRAGLLEPSRG